MMTTSMDIAQKTTIPYSTALLAYDRASTRGFLLDMVPLGHEDVPYDKVAAEKNIGRLALILSDVDTEIFGILKCSSMIRVEGRNNQLEAFRFAFDLPRNARKPRSLRTLLLETPGKSYALNDRLNIAQQLARSIIFLHSANLLHKNISPETIVVFRDAVSKIDKPYLVGFRDFRFEDGRTYLNPDSAWERNLYRHPRRQNSPEEKYKMQHDMYSLGVCLLEIGLWTSFVAYPSSESTALAGDEDLKQVIDVKNSARRALAIKSFLVRKAEDELPSRIGRRFAGIVKSCLTCLDPGNVDFGAEEDGSDLASDEDGTLVGVRYIDKVCGG